MTEKDENPPANDTGQKQRGRPFPAGQSGNPNGRPRGSRNAATILAEELMAKDIKDVVEKVVAEAKGGDMAAARILLDRIAPVRKGRFVEIDLGDTLTAQNLVTAQGRVIESVTCGDITPEEASALSDLLDAKRRAIDTAELLSRIEALEERFVKKERAA